MPLNNTNEEWEIIGEMVQFKQNEAIESYKSELVKEIELEPELVKMSDGRTYRNVLDRDKVISLINNK